VNRLATWLAMLTDRRVRVLTCAVAALAGLLLAAGVTLIVRSGNSGEGLPAPGDWTEASGLTLAALPAAPDDTTGALEPTPAPLLGDDAVAKNAADQFVALGTVAQPFRFAGPPVERQRARACLAAAMLYEAGGSTAGQLAVGQVVLNRVRHPAFPGSVCGVVLQGSERADGCQFTFTCDGSLSRSYTSAAVASALLHADLMLDGYVFWRVGLATHYHTEAVYPWWSPQLDKIAQVGPHLFFRWRGFWGSPAALAAKRKQPEPPAPLLARFDPGSTLVAAGAQGASVENVDDAAVALLPSMPQPAIGRKPASSALERAGSASSALIPEARRLSVAKDERVATSDAAPELPGGVRLARAFSDSGVFLVIVPPQTSGSQRRQAAELLCGGRGVCHVLGWPSMAEIPRTALEGSATLASAPFTFSRSQQRTKRTAGVLEDFR
jgi:spore germination cell wall hydrolase CwlJ-like protein